ncbi:MAG TPA: hypothetical protein VL979_00735 [Solirubrobacteraceae bacterium]|nr:hypothetical protein [Solirubrobacteraceae bacterium]
MRSGQSPTRSARAEAWLWTGPVGHFAGGALDLAGALARYGRARARARTADRVRSARPRLLGLLRRA